MAIATETRTQLSLDRFAAVAGVSPLHFNQVFVRDLMDAHTCDLPLMQFPWQTAGRTGRESLAEAIAAAEDMIISELGFLPVAGWTKSEEVPGARPANPGLFSGSNLDIRSFWNTVKANKGYIITGGQEAKTLIAAAQAIVYSDPDGDGYFELATITVATTVTDVEEIALYYPGHSGQEEWRIRPLRSVTIAAGTATITCKREQLVLENELFKLNPEGIDGLDNALFLTTIDVYRVYNDPSVQSQFIWDVVGGSVCNCSGEDSCPICGFSAQNGCMVARNPKLGIVSPQPGAWDAATSTFDANEFSVGRSPDRVRLWYRSGWRRMDNTWPLLQMDSLWERVITYLTLANIQRPFCSCEPLEANTLWWREDLAHNESTAGKTSSWQFSRGMLDNPFGTTRAAIYAWNQVQKHKLGQYG